jgi:beta-lactamase regulating signal transducer with metallopeptidase domain
MTLDLVIELAWKSLLCAGATLLLLRLLRGRSAAEKSVVAHLGLLALVLLPLGALTLPEIEIAAPAPVAAAFPALPHAAQAFPAPGAAAKAAPAAFSWPDLAMLLYACPALALLLLLALGVGRLQRIRARSEVIVDPRWLAALAGAQHRLGFKHGTALLTSGELDSPVSWGIVRPIIIVDPLAAGDTAHAETIIAHELAHVVRLDWLKLLAGRVAVALFWFNPLVWTLARQSHQLCEEAADDAVLATQVDRHDYADLLLGAVRQANRSFVLAANGVAPSRSSLAKRIAHVLDPARPRGTARFGWAVASLVGALSLNLTLAAAEPVLAAPLEAGVGASTAVDLARIPVPQAQRLAEAIRRHDWAARGVEGKTLFDAPEAVAPLIAALRDEDPVVRRLAVWGLAEMRPTVGEAAADPVARLLADPDTQVRGEAARALGDFAATGQAAAIARLLRDPDPGVREQAAHALGDLQSPATRPALEAALNDPVPEVRSEAGWALRQVADAEAVLERYGGG